MRERTLPGGKFGERRSHLNLDGCNPRSSEFLPSSVAGWHRGKGWGKRGKDEVRKPYRGRDPRHVPGPRVVAQCGCYGAVAAECRVPLTGGCPRGRPSTETETAKFPRSSSSRPSEETSSSRCHALPRAWRSLCLLPGRVPGDPGHCVAKKCGAAGKSGTPHPDPSRIRVASPVRNLHSSRVGHRMICVASQTPAARRQRCQ